MRRRLAGLIGGEAAKRVPQLQIIGTVMTEDVDVGQDQFLLFPLVSSSTWCLMFWCRYKSQSEQSLIQKDCQANQVSPGFAYCRATSSLSSAPNPGASESTIRPRSISGDFGSGVVMPGAAVLRIRLGQNGTSEP